jgi:hypothetical protein
LNNLLGVGTRAAVMRRHAGDAIRRDLVPD